MSKGHTLQDPYLNVLRKERVPVSIYLVNGIKLQGQIESFDQFVVLLKNTVSQMVYKHAISTVVLDTVLVRVKPHIVADLGRQQARIDRQIAVARSDAAGLPGQSCDRPGDETER